ncbi:ubiquitin-like protein Pup [Corynebacterium lizhenjunii]|uniref:Prokaryotic ubiquitin-like protein Pup n=1 Tax=Corynebacterium lizhenjunii TaxID=2709394 RepID=A0A7T0KGK0_9CORY|nr:ubiquitin-like protein Pup [Corynebacterium lizhenjunii]QPK80189.1 ubiquitin-like protein Pup [Corynebacterium lizhenjunii]
MAQDNVFLHGPGSGESEGPEGGQAAGQVQFSTAGTEDLLDEIDGLLEANAEEFVRAYVQKGGQ